MNRNHTEDISSRPKQRQEIRYNGKNPPPDKETALTRIESLETDVSQIEARLDHTKPGTFANKVEYDSWRNRATSALGWTRRELSFLNQWIIEKKTGEEKQTSQKNSRGLQQIATQIRQRAKELAEEIGCDYSPVFSQTSQPNDIGMAQERATELTTIRLRLQSAFSEITAAWTEHPLGRSSLSGVKTPLTKVMSKIETETAIVRGYIRKHSPSSDWKVVCVRAIERAAKEGFVLTSEEHEVLRQIKAIQ